LLDNIATNAKVNSWNPQLTIRFVHLLGEVNEEDYDFVSTASDPASNTKIQALESRVESLEEQLARLREEFDKLMEQLS